MWGNFIHDPDLQMLNNDTIQLTEQRLDVIRNLIKKYKLPGSASARKDIYISSIADSIYDEHIALWLLQLAQERMEMKLRVLRTAVTNDPLRKTVLDFIKKDVKLLDKTIKALKLRGWVNQPPLYPNLPNNCDEDLDCGEAYHIWDHLTFRYDNIEATQVYLVLSHDGDFKALLKKGLQDILKKQAKKLEDETIKFGLPMPMFPPEITKELQDTEFRNDKSMYKQLLEGMQGASMMHAQAIKQSVTNDRLRGIFVNLFEEEIEMLDNIVKYGKLKAWLNPPPLYRL